MSARPLLAARLDVRRNSAFDVAAGVAPVLTLDEHFRSDPHLVDFIADRIYGGALKVATRAPSTASRDCVKVVRTEGCRDRSGVVAAEVDWVVRELERLRGLGARSVGVITPFRAQADALEAAVLGRFSTDDLETLDLRVGTVHAFQGNERDMVVASLGIGPGQDTASWRFVEDPHLFTVLFTRARRHLSVLVSGDPPAGGLVAAYLAQAARRPDRLTMVPRRARGSRTSPRAPAAVGSPLRLGSRTELHGLRCVPLICWSDSRRDLTRMAATAGSRNGRDRSRPVPGKKAVHRTRACSPLC